MDHRWRGYTQQSFEERSPGPRPLWQSLVTACGPPWTFAIWGLHGLSI